MNWLVVVKKVEFKITYFALLHVMLSVNTLFDNGMAGVFIGCTKLLSSIFGMTKKMCLLSSNVIAVYDNG